MISIKAVKEKRKPYNGYEEFYLNGQQIRDYFKNSYELFGRHHSQVSSYKINFKKFYPLVKDDTLYRIFISKNFCIILDNLTDDKIYFFGYTNDKPKWAKD